MFPEVREKPGHQVSVAFSTNPCHWDGEKPQMGLEEEAVFCTEAGEGLDLLDNTVMTKILISSSFPRRLQGTSN